MSLSATHSTSTLDLLHYKVCSKLCIPYGGLYPIVFLEEYSVSQCHVYFKNKLKNISTRPRQLGLRG